MSCLRAAAIDVESFLLDSGAADFESFRAHFVECDDCANAVERWTAFDVALRDVLASPEGDSLSAHPEPDRLEAFLSSPRTMGDQAMRIENHLSACPSCRTELDVLRAYDPRFLAAAPGGEVDEETSGVERMGHLILERFRGFVNLFSFEGGFRGPVISALGMALIIVAGFWWSGFDRSSGSLGSALEPARTAHVATPENSRPSSWDPPGPEPSDEIDGRPQGPVDDSVRIAGRRQENSESGRSRPPSAIERSPSRSDESAPVQLAEAAGPETGDVAMDTARSRPRTSPPFEEGIEEKKGASPHEEILLAALREMPLPEYAAPSGSESVGWMRQFGAVRSRPPGATVAARAPADHAGLSLSNSPRLWWSLSRDVEFPVEVTIVDDRAIDPVLRVRLAGPHESGLHLFDLSDYDLKLVAGIDYRWFVSLIVDPNHPSRNPVSAGALRVIPEADWRRDAAGEMSPVERGHTMARLGIWYDAYDFFASLSVAHPEVAPIARYRDRLVELSAKRP